MKRHKWKDISQNGFSKVFQCTKCGIEKSWCYGDMQCWEYTDYQSAIGSQRTTLNRPACEPGRGSTGGFKKTGEYIYW